MPDQIHFRGPQGAGLVAEVAEGALHGQAFGGEGAGGGEVRVRAYSSCNKWLALPDGWGHINVMNSTVLEPKRLRPELIQRVEAMDDESLMVLHKALLIVEKEQLWRELSAEAEQDRRSGKLDRLPDIIRQARAELRKE